MPSVQHLSAWLAQQGSSPRPLQVYVTGQNKKSPQKNPLSLSLSLCLFLSLSLFFINCDTDSAVASLCQPTHVKRDLVHVKRDLVHTDSAVASPCHSFTTGPPPQGGDLVNLNLTPYLNPTPYTLNPIGKPLQDHCSYAATSSITSSLSPPHDESPPTRRAAALNVHLVHCFCFECTSSPPPPPPPPPPPSTPTSTLSRARALASVCVLET